VVLPPLAGAVGTVARHLALVVVSCLALLRSQTLLGIVDLRATLTQV
jgi:hypothetical protein